MIILAPLELLASIKTELLEMLWLSPNTIALELTLICPALILVSDVKAACNCPAELKFATALSPILEAVTLEFKNKAVLVVPVPPALVASVPERSDKAVGIVVLEGRALIPAAVTCPLPAPLKVPFAFIVIPLFVKVATLVSPVPPFDAGNCPLPSKLPFNSIAPAAIFAAVIVFAEICLHQYFLLLFFHRQS